MTLRSCSCQCGQRPKCSMPGGVAVCGGKCWSGLLAAAGDDGGGSCVPHSSRMRSSRDLQRVRAVRGWSG
eukprot:scaffold6695_cov136-Isochrysis_galbana.AAC.1